MTFYETDMEMQILAGLVIGVNSIGLGDDNLEKGEGDNWSDAMSHRGIWGDE